MNTIALFGACGPMGRSIGAALSAQGRRWRAVGREGGRLRAAFGADPLAECTVWDPGSPASVRAACQGVHTLVYLVGVPYWQFALHPELMRRTLLAATAAGVQRIVLVGTVYPYGRRQGGNPVGEDHPRAPHTFKGRMRLAQEDLLLQAHAAGQIEATVLRLPDFYGPDVASSLLHGAATAAVRGGTADMVGPLDAPHEFVFVPDVGPVVARLLDAPGAWGRVWHLGGAGVTSQRALVAEMQRLTARPLRLRVAGRGMLRLLGLVNRTAREMVEMHYLLSEPLVLDDTALAQLIGPLRKTPYAEGIRQTLAAVPAPARAPLTRPARRA